MADEVDEHRPLREVVAEAIERGIRQQESGWDACPTCLGRVADVVLADLAEVAERQADIRSLAVEIVDMVHGFTYEFSNQQGRHLHDYDWVENRLTTAHIGSGATDG